MRTRFCPTLWPTHYGRKGWISSKNWVDLFSSLLIDFLKAKTSWSARTVEILENSHIFSIFPRSMYLVQIWIFGAQTTFNLWTILYQIGHSDWMGLWMYFAAPDQFTTIIHMSEMWPFKFGFPNKNTHTMYVRHYKIIRTQINHLWQKKIWLLSWITTWK